MTESHKRHIVMISNTAFSMWNFRRAVMKDMIAKGCQVTCMAAFDHTVDDIKKIGVEFIPIQLSRAGVNPFSEIITILSLYAHLKKLKPDLIISYTIKPNSYVPPMAKWLGIQSIAVSTGLGYAFIKDNMVARLARHTFRFGLKCADEIWFLNQDDCHFMCGESASLLNKASVLPGEGIDTDYFNDRNFPEPPQNKFVFLMVARLLKDKGIYEFAQAAKIIKTENQKAEFNILGPIDEENPSGLSTDEWKDLCCHSGITYKGAASDVRPFIAASHVCVLPSYREGIPFALLEGGSMRRPLIATDVAGCRDVVENGRNGYIVKPRDVNDLVHAMRTMINMDKDLFVDMQNVSRAIIVDRFCTQKVIDQYCRLYINKT